MWNGMVLGITWKEWPWNERNRIDDAQIERRQMPTLDLGIVNPSIPSSSTTTTIIDNTHPPSHPCHHHLIATITLSSPSSMATSHHIYCPRPAQQGWRGNAMSPTKRVPDASTTAWGIQGATSLAATWQAHDEQRWCHRSLLLFLFVHNVSCSSPFVCTDIANDAYTTLPLLYHTTTALHHTPAPQSPPPPHLGHPITTTITPDNATSR